MISSPAAVKDAHEATRVFAQPHVSYWASATTRKARGRLSSAPSCPCVRRRRSSRPSRPNGWPRNGCASQDRLLARNGHFGVYLAKGAEAPRLLQELGRLREVTFRAAGEGTGKRIDLDSFDQYYWHLLLWHGEKKELVGAYRIGNTAAILAEHGIAGLYTSTCFRYDPRFFQRIGPAFELGRSFIRVEYQREYAPLLLLWKGIAGLVVMHPECPVLFGAVSISNTYSRASREIIYRFFEARKRGDELAGLVEPRQPFRAGLLRRWDCRAMCHALRDLDELSQPIADVEADGKGLPVLLRQYAKVGGKLARFQRRPQVLQCARRPGSGRSPPDPPPGPGALHGP